VALTLLPQTQPWAQVLPGPEAFDTAFVLLKFANGKEAAIDVCRKATYGYDQRAEVLGTYAMMLTTAHYSLLATYYE
jgi:myo-inositol 2-dehydrogenase/D-chiro-inositol 1-dehydrogenase